MHCTRKVKDDLIWVGVDDRRLVCFEGVYGVPNGVSYNSYLLLDEKTALFDTVDKAVYQTFFENIAYELNGRRLDYLVISHMEPDHAYTLESLVVHYPEVKIVCNAKMEAMMKNYFRGTDFSDRLMVVKEGDTLSFGRHTITFFMAPMVHWPEVMMSYDLTDKILFSADAFGTFGALNGRLFADETNFFAEDIDEARRYYTNIVGKYGMQVQSALKKASAYDIDCCCPLHGYVWRSHMGDYLDKYLKWSTYTPEENSVMIAYASVYGHTENVANILAAKLVERGIRVRMYDTSVTPASYIVSDAFRCSHLIFASTTYNAGIFVNMENLLNDIVCHNLQNRKIALIENGSWAPTSGKLMMEKLSVLKNCEFINDKLSITSSIQDDQMDELMQIVDAISSDIAPVPVTAVEGSSEDISAEALAGAVVEKDAFYKLSYGLEILTTRVDGRDYGCIINTAEQVSSSDPRRVVVSVIKKNHTCDMIQKSGKFNVSILTEETPYDLIRQFGFQSGRDVDKFAAVTYSYRSVNGIRYIPEYTNAYLSCEVIETKDLDTSMLFIADVVEAGVLGSDPSCTYDYYHAHIKPKKNPAPEKKEGYVCKVCGYFHEGSEMADDFVCPLCKHGKDDFEFVPVSGKQKVKGYVCTICGHFEPCDGELPDDYTCPLCKHGKDDFEAAEQ